MATGNSMGVEFTTFGIKTTSDLAPDTFIPIVSDELRELLWYAIFTCTCSFLSYAGVISNLLAIVTFFKMGFQDTINISLLHLVLCDFVRSFLMVVYRFHAVIHFFDQGLEFSWASITFFGVGYVWGTMGYISGTLAGYISMERCLCVSRPFTVKYLVTRRFVVSVNIIISLLIFASFMPYFGNMKLTLIHHPSLNKTVPALSFIEVNGAYDNLLNIMGVFWLVLSLSIICVCTVITSHYLRKSSKFRNQTINNQESNDSKKALGPRHQKIMKMLLVVILVYLITTLPRALLWFIRGAFPHLDLDGRQENLLYSMFAFVGVSDCLNGLLNPFIFFFMSAQFHAKFLETFKPKCL